MNHTYLFKEGVWLISGKYFAEDGHAIPVEGKSRVTHTPDLWIKDGYMKLLDESNYEIKNKYEIVPFKNDFTSWSSLSPSLGMINGKFMVIEDTIISIYTSEDMEYSGAESLTMVSDKIYLCKGFTFKANAKLSSWATELIYIGQSGGSPQENKEHIL